MQRTLPSVLLLDMCFARGLVAAQDIRMLVLDARSGMPQSRVEVVFLCERYPRNSSPATVTTDLEGVAMLHQSCKENERIDIEATALPKEKCRGVESLTIAEISSSGVITDPMGAGGIDCPTKVSKRLKPIPGQVIIFIKKPTWWQSHVAG